MSLWKWVLLIAVAVFLLVFIPGNLADQNKAVRLLQEQGFSDITVVSRDIWFVEFRGGSREDTAMFTIDATNPVGRAVTVHVFVGWPFKGATLRGY